MIDKEKVIKDLEECLNSSCRGWKPGIYCPFPGDVWDSIEDAIALLLEQEPTPVFKRSEFGVTGGVCPRCNNWIPSPHTFCGFCGQEVMWE